MLFVVYLILVEPHHLGTEIQQHSSPLHPFPLHQQTEQAEQAAPLPPAEHSTEPTSSKMGIISDVLCFPCKLLSAVMDVIVVIFCCPCRVLCGCPSTSSETGHANSVV
jgi:hypothetical protein